MVPRGITYRHFHPKSKKDIYIYIFQQSPVCMRGSKQFDYKQKKYNYLDQIFHSNDNNSLTHSKKNGKLQASNNEQSYALIYKINQVIIIDNLKKN